MNDQGAIVTHMKALLELFALHCTDQTTNRQLLTMLDDPSQWRLGHRLFRDIRTKTLRTENAKSELANAQYLFEEICAKTLYNLSGEPAPFDADSPCWIIPNALLLAKRLGLGEDAVQALIDQR